jgi:hypothetical protein
MLVIYRRIWGAPRNWNVKASRCRGVSSVQRSFIPRCSRSATVATLARLERGSPPKEDRFAFCRMRQFPRYFPIDVLFQIDVLNAEEG